MTGKLRTEHGARVAMALLRAMLVVVIFVTEQLVDARQLGDSGFFAILAIAAFYSLAGIVVAGRDMGTRSARIVAFLQPGFDVLLLAAIVYTSGGAFSDARKAFFVIPLAAAFSERPRQTASWSLLAVTVFTFVAMLAGDHARAGLNSWQRVTLNQDLYLAWTGGAATLLALGLGRRSAHIAQLAHSRQRLVHQSYASIERERTRLAGALHDSPVQNLIAARHDLRRAERSGDPESFARLREALDLTIAELREEIFKLHPHVLDHVGLSAALDQVARHHTRNQEAEILVTVDAECEQSHREVLFALGRELLGNASKHAEAGHIELTLRRERDSVALEVHDDGRGIPDGRIRQAVLDGHVGLAAMRERVSALGGDMEITTAPGAGTRVRVVLPDAGLAGRRASGVSDRVTALDTFRVSTV
jgi:two-component system, NarL family, sensor kinase